ncbi:cell division protein FtsQ/DivIB [Fredinandcohnia humi]
MNVLAKQKVVTIEDRIPKLKQRRKQKANRRLILYITLFFLLLSGVVYFQSPLSRIGTITIKGNRNISNEQISELSELQIGTSFWKVNNEKNSKLISKHPEIKEVHIDKKLPNKIIITVSEHRRVGYIASNNDFLPLLENGKIVTTSNTKADNLPVDAPILMGWDEEHLKPLAKELAKIEPTMTNLISEIHYTPTEYDPLHMTLYMNDGYEVRATVRNFANHITAYPSIVNELAPSLKGYIELDVVPTFIPYEQEIINEEEEMVTDETEG